MKTRLNTLALHLLTVGSMLCSLPQAYAYTREHSPNYFDPSTPARFKTDIITGTQMQLASQAASHFIATLGVQVTGQVQVEPPVRHISLGQRHMYTEEFYYRTQVPTDQGLIPVVVQIEESYVQEKNHTADAKLKSIFIRHPNDITLRPPESMNQIKQKLKLHASKIIGSVIEISAFPFSTTTSSQDANAASVTYKSATDYITFFVRDDAAGVSLIGMKGSIPQSPWSSSLPSMAHSVRRGDAQVQETVAQWLERVGALGHKTYKVKNRAGYNPRGWSADRELNLNVDKNGVIRNGASEVSAQFVKPNEVHIVMDPYGDSGITIKLVQKRGQLFPELNITSWDQYDTVDETFIPADSKASPRAFKKCGEILGGVY